MGPPISPKFTSDKVSLSLRQKTFFVIGWGGNEENFGRRKQFQQNYSPRKPPGHISLGHFNRVYLTELLFRFHISMFCPSE